MESASSLPPREIQRDQGAASNSGAPRRTGSYHWKPMTRAAVRDVPRATGSSSGIAGRASTGGRRQPSILSRSGCGGPDCGRPPDVLCARPESHSSRKPGSTAGGAGGGAKGARGVNPGFPGLNGGGWGGPHGPGKYGAGAPREVSESSDGGSAAGKGAVREGNSTCIQPADQRVRWAAHPGRTRAPTSSNPIAAIARRGGMQRLTWEGESTVPRVALQTRP